MHRIIAPLLGILLLTGACSTGVDKDREQPEPAVGRSFDTTDTSRTRDLSHPIRNMGADSTITDTAH